MFGMKRLIGGALAAGVLAALPAPALAVTPVTVNFGFGQRCSEDWQLVNYGLFIYLQAPSAQAKEQLLHEVNADARRATLECGFL